MEKKITLITITYNRIEHFQRLLESLKCQTIFPSEFIVSDDGSKDKDELLKLLKKEKINFPNMKIKFIQQKDLGFRLSRARNNAAREAAGNILIFIDSDVIIPPKFLENFYKKSKKNIINLSRSIRLEEEASKRITLEDIRSNDLRKYYTFKLIWKNIERFFRDKIYSCFKKKKSAEKFRAMAFSIYREDYIKINGFDERFIGWGSEDVEFGVRCFFCDIKIKNSHLNNFQLHQWHDEYSKGNEKEEEYKNEIWSNMKKDYIPEYGYNKTYGEDKYEVMEI